MRSIHCPNCGEPWEGRHLLEQAPHDWGLDPEDLERLLRKQRFRGDSDPARRLAEAAGWRFASDHLEDIERCPACPRTHSVLRAYLARQAS